MGSSGVVLVVVVFFSGFFFLVFRRPSGIDHLHVRVFGDLGWGIWGGIFWTDLTYSAKREWQLRFALFMLISIVQNQMALYFHPSFLSFHPPAAAYAECPPVCVHECVRVWVAIFHH